MSPQFIGAILIMVVGIVASLIPMMPASVITWLGAFFYASTTDFKVVGWGTLIVLAILAIAASTSDIWVGAIRRQRSGASLASNIGGLIGGIIGLFVFALPGMLIGTIIGTMLPDWQRWRDWRHFTNISWRTVKNWIVGIAVQMSIGVLMLIIFIVRVVSAS